MILFCECGSDRVDVMRWDRALFRCLSCNQERWVEGLPSTNSISSAQPASVLSDAELPMDGCGRSLAT
jgi:hypothetical protein